MKIRIKQFRGTSVVNGFFPIAGKRMKPGDVFDCGDDEKLFDRCMATDLVEIVPEEKEAVMAADDPEEHDCPACDASFKTDRGLMIHMAKAHAESQSG